MRSENAKAFVRRHFEDFVNRQYLSATDQPPGPDGPKQYLVPAFKRFPDIHVTIEDIIAEGNTVVVRNTWRATDLQAQQKIQFGGIVISRIVDGKLAERWAYLQTPHPVH